MRRGLCLLGGLLLAFGAFVLSIPVWAADTCPSEVRVEDDFFFPPQCEVFAGTTVVWRSFGTSPHTVTQDASGGFNSHPNCQPFLNPTQTCMRNGEPFSHQFNEAGSYRYHCEVHSQMRGTIVVNGPLPTSTSSSTTSTTVAGGTTTTRRTTPIPGGPVPPIFTVPTGQPPLLPPDTIPPNLPGSVTDPTPLDVGPLQAGPGDLTDDVVLDTPTDDDRPWVPAMAAFLLLSGAAVSAMVTARRTLGEGMPPLPPA